MSGYCKYYKQKRQVSYDSGLTWTDTGEYQKGELYETNSIDCGYVGSMTRWINSGTTCNGYNKYNLQIKQESYDGGSTWTTTTPVETRQGTLIESYSTDCGYVPPYPSVDEYFTTTALENGAFGFISSSNYSNPMRYSTDNGNTWNIAPSATTIQIQAGESVLWKSIIVPKNEEGIGRFVSTCRFNAHGNAMSLLFGDNFIGQTSLSGKSYAFYRLFWSCSKIVNASGIALPATTLASYCYYDMFAYCTSLTSAPQLPATTLVNRCYGGMFQYCKSLTTAPVLPATTLANRCYISMFDNCTSLTTAPALPATTLADYCYAGMFGYCTSLTTPPQLSATTLTEYCYKQMFYGCTSLTTAPALPAITLADSCYQFMFTDCTSLTTAPELPATTLANSCYGGMFQGCTSLNYIKCLATNISATYCTSNWVSNVAASGTFTKASSMNDWTTGISGIPSNWTVQNA